MQANNNDNKTNDTKTNDKDDTYVKIENPYEEEEKGFIGLSPYEEIDGHRIELLSFHDWNRKQDETNRIVYVRKFTSEPMKIKVLAGVPGAVQKLNDKTGQMETITYTKYPIKEDRGDGRETSPILESPSFISKRGYRDNETTSGVIRSIAHTIDFSNPHHRQWWEVAVMSVVNGYIEHIMTVPAEFGIKKSPITNFSDKTSKAYKDLYSLIFNQLPDLARIPKNGKEFDLKSNLRMLYCNPIDFENKEDPKKSSYMKVYYMGKEMSLDNLLKNCQGWQNTPDGIIKGNPQGFEFSYSLLIHKGTKTKDISISFKTAAVYIHRFFDAPSGNLRSLMNAAEISKDIIDVNADYSKFFFPETKKEPEVIPNNKDFKPLPQKPESKEAESKEAEEKSLPVVPPPVVFQPPLIPLPVQEPEPVDKNPVPQFLSMNPPPIPQPPPQMPKFVPQQFVPSTY